MCSAWSRSKCSPLFPQMGFEMGGGGRAGRWRVRRVRTRLRGGRDRRAELDWWTIETFRQVTESFHIREGQTMRARGLTVVHPVRVGVWGSYFVCE